MVFLFYENPLTHCVKTTLRKCCKKKSSYKVKMQKVEQKSKWLKSKLDLKKILVQLHNFELNITRVFDHLEIQKFNEDAFDIMDR